MTTNTQKTRNEKLKDLLKFQYKATQCQDLCLYFHYITVEAEEKEEIKQFNRKEV